MDLAYVQRHREKRREDRGTVASYDVALIDDSLLLPQQSGIRAEVTCVILVLSENEQ